MEPILRAEGLCKIFGQFYALKDVNLEAYPGEVNVLMGENGAGKSTLMKILSGVYQKDGGQVFLEGKKVEIPSPHAAEQLGIGTVYQELALVPGLSVAENMFLGTSLVTNKAGFVDWKYLYEESARVLRDLVGMEIDTRRNVGSLGIAQQQMIEIARVVYRNTKILILDEPTAVLTSKEVTKLFEIVENLKKKGIAIIYISHRMEEIFQIGNRVTVLRDGRWVGKSLVSELDTDQLIRMMVGRSIENQFPKADFSNLEKKEVLRVENLCRGDHVKNVSFSVRTGEILGIAGLVGAGRTEVARLIFGADRPSSGDIYLNGKKAVLRSPKDAIAQGVALLPEDRKYQGLVLKHSVEWNSTIVALQKLMNRFRLLDRKKERQDIQSAVQRFRIAVNDVASPVSSLSGGNQQKVVIAKWMYADADIVIFDEPTRGIDVGAKTEVYEVMNDLIRQGKAVVMISSEMPELRGMCDRILTMRMGEISGEFDNREPISEDELLKAMIG